MTIAVACQCGKRFAAKPELAGKRVKCPACGQVLAVPGGAGPQAVTASPAAAAAPVTVSCECGGRFQAPAHLFGKQVACPRCRRTLTVPNPALAASDNSFGASANDPLGLGSQDAFGMGGAGAWGQGAPLAGATYPTAGGWPAQNAGGTPRATQAKGGVPTWIWIVAGIGGVVCLMLVVGVIALGMFGGGDGETAGDATSNDVADGSSATTNSNSTSNSSSAAKTTAAPPPKVDDARAFGWQPSPWSAISAGSQQPIRLAFRPSKMWISSVGALQAVISSNPYETRTEPGYLLHRLDLATGQTNGEITLEKDSELVGVAPDCSSFLMFPPAARYDHSRLQLWQWSGSTAKMVKEWQPYESKTKHETRINSYLLASSSCVLTRGSNDKFATAWDATTGRQSYRLPDESEIGVTVSPSGSPLLHIAGIWMRIFDVKSGEHRGSVGPIPANYYSASAAAVSPSGKLLATVIFRSDTSSYVVAVWSLADRKQLHEIRCSGAPNGVLWCGEEYLVVGEHLVSLQHERAVWKYQPSPAAVAGNGACWFQMSVGNEHYLYTGQAPSAEVISGIDEFLARDTVLLKSGDSVSLEFQVTASQIPADSEASKLQQLLNDNLQKSGYSVAEGQEFKLRVTIAEEDTGQTLQYDSFAGGSKSSFHVPQRLLKCSAVMTNSQGETTYDEKATYQTGSFGGMEFNAPNNEAEFAKLLLERRWKGVQDWLSQLVFPKEIRAFSGVGKYPTSRVEPAGETIDRIGS